MANGDLLFWGSDERNAVRASEEAVDAVLLLGTMIEALPNAASRAAEVCPTGAFSLKDGISCYASGIPK